MPFLGSSYNIFTLTSSVPETFFGLNWSSSLATSWGEKNLIRSSKSEDMSGVMSVIMSCGVKELANWSANRSTFSWSLQTHPRERRWLVVLGFWWLVTTSSLWLYPIAGLIDSIWLTSFWFLRLSWWHIYWACERLLCGTSLPLFWDFLRCFTNCLTSAGYRSSLIICGFSWELPLWPPL